VPSSAARNTSHQSRRCPTVPARWSSAPDAQRLMTVCWSSTRSASCSRPSFTRAFASGRAPRAMTTRSSSAVSVHGWPSTLDLERTGLHERERGDDARRVLVPMRAGRSSAKNRSGSSSARGASTRLRTSTPTPTTLGRRADAKRRRRLAGTTAPAAGSARANPAYRFRSCAARARGRFGKRGRTDEVERVEQVAGVRVPVGQRARGFPLVSINFRIDVWSCT